jgi:hypothetical protein
VVKKALRGGKAWWVAPSYKVAAVGWDAVQRLSRQIDGTMVRQVDRRIDFPGGGWLQVRSADDPNSLRGEGLDLVVMDECAFTAEAAWNEALRPALSDRKGEALFISTPKGQNWFWRAWMKGQEEGNEWMSWRFPSVTNPFLDPAEIEAARKDQPERLFLQEYEAEFLEESGGVFRGVTAAVDKGRKLNETPKEGMAYSAGVDLARIEDFTVIDVVDATGKQVHHERFNRISWERQVAAIAATAKRFKCPVHLDSTGIGDPIHEDIRKAGVSVRPYLFTNASKESLIDNLAIRIERGQARLMDLPTQTAELLAYQYELTPSRNVRMNAPEGMHDDCVIGLALAYWGLGKPDKVRFIQ